MNKRDDEFRDKMRDLWASTIPEDVMVPVVKQAENLAHDFADRIEWWLKDELSEIMSGYVADMADRAIESMLAGNEAMFRRYLHCEQNSYSFTGRDRDHPVIHGKLFEADCITLRRSLCQAFPELLSTERILDLESQVSGLVDEVNKREAEIERLRERLR